MKKMFNNFKKSDNNYLVSYSSSVIGGHNYLDKLTKSVNIQRIGDT